MKVLAVILIGIGIVWYFGFYSKDAIFHDYSGDSGYFLGREICPNLVPHNAYPSSSGQSAGFEWAHKNSPSSCASDSVSFTEGCMEYVRQAQAHEACVNK